LKLEEASLFAGFSGDKSNAHKILLRPYARARVAEIQASMARHAKTGRFLPKDFGAAVTLPDDELANFKRAQCVAGPALRRTEAAVIESRLKAVLEESNRAGGDDYELICKLIQQAIEADTELFRAVMAWAWPDTLNRLLHWIGRPDGLPSGTTVAATPHHRTTTKRHRAMKRHERLAASKTPRPWSPRW
jgi:hypothetical protein